MKKYFFLLRCSTFVKSMEYISEKISMKNRIRVGKERT